MKSLLRPLAQAFAVAGAAVGLATAIMVAVSVASRALTSRPIQGDVEITQFAIALAISLGLPWCQWRRANIIVDFFTQGASRGARRALDAAGCALVAAMCALLAWRTGAGALAVQAAGETTMVLALPVWWIYAALAPGLALTALIALQQGWRHLNVLPVGDEEEQAAR